MACSESFSADYEALTTGCGFVELGNWSTVAMKGEDRQSFLHNMCTNDILRLSPGEGCEAFCTDVKGKIVAHLFVIAREDQLELLTVPGQAASLIAHLDRYVIREDVQFADLSSEACWFLLAGAESNTSLAALSSGAVPELREPWQHTQLAIGEADCLIARCKLIWSAGYLLRCSSEEKERVTKHLQATGARPCSADALTALRIESRWPWFEVDFSAENLSQEVDRDQQAISFNKGCYLGQETVARIDALGHVNRKVVLIKFAGETLPTADLELTTSGKKVGRVTSSCWSPLTQSPLSLATVRRGANAVDSQIENDLGLATVIAPVEQAP